MGRMYYANFQSWLSTIKRFPVSMTQLLDQPRYVCLFVVRIVDSLVYTEHTFCFGSTSCSLILSSQRRILLLTHYCNDRTLFVFN